MNLLGCGCLYDVQMDQTDDPFWSLGAAIFSKKLKTCSVCEVKWEAIKQARIEQQRKKAANR